MANRFDAQPGRRTVRWVRRLVRVAAQSTKWFPGGPPLTDSAGCRHGLGGPSGWTVGGLRNAALKQRAVYLRERGTGTPIPCVCSHAYNLSMRSNYINSMMARMNRAVGDAAEMTRILDEPRLVEDSTHAEVSQAGSVCETLWDRQSGAFLEGDE